VEAWWDDSSSDWVEYSSPYDTMGTGMIDSTTPDLAAHHSLSARLCVDWLSMDSVAAVEPYADGVPLCSPCGPYVLQPIDAGSLEDDVLVGVEVATGLDYRHLYVEYRANPSEGGTWWNGNSAGVLFTFADQGGEGNYWTAADYGGTGTLSDSVLVRAGTRDRQILSLSLDSRRGSIVRIMP